MPTSKLTVMQIKSAKPKDKEYKFWDGAWSISTLMNNSGLKFSIIIVK